MNASVRYEIDDTDRIRPHMRLCHRMLSEALAAGFTAVQLTKSLGVTPAARAQVDGSWKPFMAFPPAVYRMLVEYFKQMAGVVPEPPDAQGTILVRLAGRDATIDLRARRDERGSDELLLFFPSTPAPNAATE